MDAIVAIVLIASTVGMVVSVAMLAMAAIGRLLTRRTTTERREPQRPRNHFNGRRVIARDALKNCAIPLPGSALPFAMSREILNTQGLMMPIPATSLTQSASYPTAPNT
jgi:hypothetical protein